MTTNSKKFTKSFMLYKVRKDGTGAASQWNLSSEKDCIFLEMANQKGEDDNGNASFDWDNKLRFKLGEPDIGELLSTMMGYQDGIGPFDSSTSRHKGLFHSNKKGNAILYFGKDKNDRFHIYLSVKRDNKKSVAQHTITKGEMCVLHTLLCRAISTMYRWD